MHAWAGALMSLVWPDFPVTDCAPRSPSPEMATLLTYKVDRRMGSGQDVDNFLGESNKVLVALAIR